MKHKLGRLAILLVAMAVISLIVLSVLHYVSEGSSPDGVVTTDDVTGGVTDVHGSWYLNLGANERALFSEPEDPWSVAAPPHQGTLLIFPLLEEGRMTQFGQDLQEKIDYPWRCYMPAGITTASTPELNRRIRLLAGYPDDGLVHMVSDEALKKVAAFHGATHQLSARYRETDGKLHVDAVLVTPSARVERRFEEDRKRSLKLAADINSWAVEMAGFTFEPGMPERLSAPVLGAELLDMEAEELKAMWKNAADPGWERLVSQNPEMPIIRVLRADVAYRNRQLAMCVRLDPGLPTKDAEPWMRLMRATCLYGQEYTRPAFHEMEILAAQRPGSQNSVFRLYRDFVPPELRKQFHVESLKRWHARAAPSAHADESFAYALVEAAALYRGAGWAQDVSEVGMEGYRDYNRAAVELLRPRVRSLEETPDTYHYLMRALAGTRQIRQMLEVHKECVQFYPDYSGSWSNTLNYMRPRWFGGSEGARALIDDLLRLDTKNPEVYRLVFHYYWLEAELQYHPRHVLRHKGLQSYCEKNPHAREQMKAAVEKLLLCEPPEYGHTVALTIAWALGDWPLQLKVVQDCPRSYIDWRHEIDGYMRGEILTRNIYGLFYAGEFETMLHACERAIEYQDSDEGVTAKPSERPFASDFHRSAVHGIALMMNGKAEEAIPMTIAAREQQDWHAMLLAAELANGIRHDKTQSGLDYLMTNHGDDEVAHLLKALALKLEGKDAEALAAYKDALGKEDSTMVWLRPLVREKLGVEEAP